MKKYVEVAVVGSRTIEDQEVVSRVLDYWITVKLAEAGLFEQPYSIRIVSGGADGVDRLAENWAEENGHAMSIWPAQWSLFGKKAGFMRNRDIAEQADIGVVMWDGHSKGCMHTHKMLVDMDKPVVLLNTQTGIGSKWRTKEDETGNTYVVVDVRGDEEATVMSATKQPYTYKIPELLQLYKKKPEIIHAPQNNHVHSRNRP